MDSTSPHNYSSPKLKRPPLSKKEGALLPIYSITPFTMLDFPDRTSCIIWFSGCNMRCGYCHNPQIVKSKGKYPINDVLSFLEKRKGLLDGVVLSGGEASLYPDIVDFIKTIKKMGYAVKIDTNGAKPDIISCLIENSLIDYVAIDYKAPKDKFKKVTGIEKFECFEKTLSYLCTQKDIPFEIRTTVHTSLLDENDISSIIKDLDERNYNGIFYIQNFISDNDRPTIGHLIPQKRILNREAILQPTNFPIEYRNF